MHTPVIAAAALTFPSSRFMSYCLPVCVVSYTTSGVVPRNYISPFTYPFNTGRNTVRLLFHQTNGEQHCKCDNCSNVQQQNKRLLISYFMDLTCHAQVRQVYVAEPCISALIPEPHFSMRETAAGDHALIIFDKNLVVYLAHRIRRIDE